MSRSVPFKIKRKDLKHLEFISLSHRCQGDVDECSSNPCNFQGSLNCVQGSNAYTCVCKQVSVRSLPLPPPPLPPPTPPLTYLLVLTFVVTLFACAQGYSGTNCEIKSSNCATVECLNGGYCIDSLTEALGYRCICKTVSRSFLVISYNVVTVLL